MRKNIIFAVLMLTMLSSFVLTADSKDDAKLQDAKKLLELTGAGEQGMAAMQMFIKSYQKTFPQVPEKFWDDFAKEMSADELINLTAPVYAKHLSHDDIKALIKFYQTPAAKKFIQVQPAIQKECFTIGQQWGQKIAMKVIAKLKKQGYMKKQ
jgi:hypothetical protein